MTCKTCRYWTVTDDDEYSPVITPIDPDTDEPMEGLAFEMRYCKCPKVVFYERPVESDGVALVDGSHYFAGMITGEDFGCVHHVEA